MKRAETLRETKKKIRVRVGKEFPSTGIKVRKSNRSSWKEPKDIAAVALAALLGVLMMSVTAYAMMTSNQNILEDLFDFLEASLTALLAWAISRALSK